MATSTLAELLSVTPGEGPDTFIGETEAYGVVGIYGGHYLGQALAAAFNTVDEPKLANSFHAYFLKAGNPDFPLIYKVTRARDGRAFDTRSVTAIQGDSEIFTMLASFKVQEPGDEHQKAMPNVTTAEALIAAREASGGDGVRFPMTVGGRVSMELISDHFAPREFIRGREPILQSWMRVNDANKPNARMAQCMLAYLADGTLMFNSVLPYGIPFQSHRLTSLDQSVWFHGTCDVSEWMFYDQRSTAAADSRGLNEGEVFDKSGKLIMSTAQESMLRKVTGGSE